jgi:hypothetical protein
VNDFLFVFHLDYCCGIVTTVRIRIILKRPMTVSPGRKSSISEVLLAGKKSASFRDFPNEPSVPFSPTDHGKFSHFHRVSLVSSESVVHIIQPMKSFIAFISNVRVSRMS